MYVFSCLSHSFCFWLNAMKSAYDHQYSRELDAYTRDQLEFEIVLRPKNPCSHEKLFSSNGDLRRLRVLCMLLFFSSLHHHHRQTSSSSSAIHQYCLLPAIATAAKNYCERELNSLLCLIIRVVGSFFFYSTLPVYFVVDSFNIGNRNGDDCECERGCNGATAQQCTEREKEQF